MLYVKTGPRYRPAQPEEVREIAASYAVQEKTGQELSQPHDARVFLRKVMHGCRREHMWVIFLDARHRVIKAKALFSGTIDSAHVHPRVVADHALRFNATTVILAHNHPSGVAEPSQADLAITRRIRDALGLLDIRLLDHFIVGEDEIVSMAERGLV